MKMIPLLIAIPLASAFLIALAGRRLKAFGAVTSAIAVLLAAVIACRSAYLAMTQGILVYRVGNWPAPFGIPLIIDGLSAFMLVMVNFVALLIAIYSAGYIKKFTDEWKYFSLFSVMIAGMNGVLLSGDIFNLYVFLEISAISGYFLVAFGIDADSLEASFKYAVMGAVASAFILMGIAFLYGYASTLNMADLAQELFLKGACPAIMFTAVLLLMGFGLKAALVPFHSWLPYAHSSAPAPISAMLSGISIKVLGIYAMARIFFNIIGLSHPLSHVLIFLAVGSMIVGSILAFGQTDIKRLFAYSSISQVGYVVLGLAIATPLSIIGAVFHMLNHSLAKSLLFLNSGSIEHLTGTRDMKKMSGLAEMSPTVGYTNIIGSLSICGVPPLGGFWSKLIIIIACIRAGHPILALIAAAVGILTLGYYFRALTPALFGNRAGGLSGEKLSWQMALPMVILALVATLSGAILLPGSQANELLKSASLALTNGSSYVNSITGALLK